MTGTSSRDYATIKYNFAGVEQWVARYNGPGNGRAVALEVDTSGNVYVTGWSTGHGWSVYTTIKYIQTPVSIEQEKPGTPSCFRLAQNYPNPFNAGTTIEFALARSALVNLKVYNLLGEEVATLLAEQRSAGIHRFFWDAEGLVSGVYIYQMMMDKDFMQTRKLLLLK